MAYLQHNICGGDALEVFGLENISYTYKGGNNAIDNLSFNVRDGESITIIGTNGSGKSTLLYILDGLIEPESGNLRVFGRQIRDGFPSELRQRIALLFENPQVQLFSLSVWDELSFGLLNLGLKGDEVIGRIHDLLKFLEIEHLKDRGPWDLSGGEMKKVALGTCLSINPDVLLLDEPTSGLDPRSQVDLIDIIQMLRESGKTIITATHDLALIEDISDRTLVLGEDHCLLKEGVPNEILKDRDILLKANLIHKHPHRHSWFIHNHSHYAEHEHEHLPESVHTQESIPIKKAGGEITDIGKLKKLLDHWIEHNISHKETYEEWARRMSAILKEDRADILKKIAEETGEIDKLFLRLKGIL